MVVYKTKNISKLLLGAVLPLTMLSGCMSKVEPVATYELAHVEIADNNKTSMPIQIMVENPNSLRNLDTQNIIIKDKYGSISFLKKVQWSDRLPDLIGDRIVTLLEDSNAFKAAGKQGQGIQYNYRLLLDIRSFTILLSEDNKKIAKVVLNAKIVNNSNGEVIANHTFCSESDFVSEDNASYIESLNKSFGEVASLIGHWTIAFFKKHVNKH